MFAFVGLALGLGFKHSFDADHVIAVSQFLSRPSSLRNSTRMAVYWALGHMITATLLTFVLFTFKDVFLTTILGKMDVGVGVMLVGLGLWSLRRAYHYHAHSHMHGSVSHSHAHVHGIEAPVDHPHDHAHWHVFGVGIVHGLASNDELLILLTATLGLSSLSELVMGVGLFSVGVVGGMVLYSAVFALPLLQSRQTIVKQVVEMGAGILSVIYGTILLAGVLLP